MCTKSMDIRLPEGSSLKLSLSSVIRTEKEMSTLKKLNRRYRTKPVIAIGIVLLSCVSYTQK